MKLRRTAIDNWYQDLGVNRLNLTIAVFASKWRLISFDTVKNLLLARIKRRPAHLDLSCDLHLPQPSSPPPAAPITPPCWPKGPVMAPRRPASCSNITCKKLKLPTFLREYEKLARQCAAEGLDHVQFLGAAGGDGDDRSRAAHGRAFAASRQASENVRRNESPTEAARLIRLWRTKMGPRIASVRVLTGRRGDVIGWRRRGSGGRS